MTVTSSAKPAAPVESGDLTIVSSPAEASRQQRLPLPRAVVPNPRIVRPAGLPRAARPGAVPTPEHRHLPGWVRRAHGLAQPILADQLGALEGRRRQELTARADELVAAISQGRFSQAWNYPRLIADGQVLLEDQRRDHSQAARARQRLEASKRRVADRLREHSASLPADVGASLNRALRAAADADAVTAVGAEVERSLSSLRDQVDRRRDREIGRTRARIQRGKPRSAPVEAPLEPWQETLRRFAEQQARESG